MAPKIIYANASPITLAFFLFILPKFQATSIPQTTTLLPTQACPYPCLPPPISTTNCPPPPLPPLVPPPPMPFLPPELPLFPPPPGTVLWAAPPPPNPILPYFPWYYKYPPPPPDSSKAMSINKQSLFMFPCRVLVALFVFLCF